jgi:immune inhibitor A
MFTYNMDPEIQSGGLVHMGFFAHEFGHTLGLSDLYDWDYSSAGLGDWSIMAHGSWNNDGKTPAHLDAWCKYKLGWIDVDTLTANLTHTEILQAETSPKAYRLWTSGGGGSQYFLVENRQKTSFDSYLPGEGLLIYHVDETVANNNNENHYKVALEQADGNFDLENKVNRGDGGDPFPGWDNKRAFDDTTIPSSRDYGGGQTQVAVWNISDSDSSMHANMQVTYCFSGDANGDGVIDIVDVVYLINYLFIGGPAPVPLAAGDANCDGVVDVSDVVYLINYLFVGGPAPCK